MALQEIHENSVALTGSKTTKTLAHRHLSKLREESLTLREQSDTFSAEVAALEEMLKQGEEGGNMVSEKKIWEDLQRLLHKRYLAEMNSLRTAAALTGQQLPLEAPSRSSQSNTESPKPSTCSQSNSATPRPSTPLFKLEDLSYELSNDSTGTGSNVEGSSSDKELNSEEELNSAEEVCSVFSFKASSNGSDMQQPSAPPSEITIPKPRWFTGANKAGQECIAHHPQPFGCILGGTADEDSSTMPPPSRVPGYSASKDATTRCNAAIARSNTSLNMEVPSMLVERRAQAPLQKQAPRELKDVSRSELIALAREARAAASKMSMSARELDLGAWPKEGREQAAKTRKAGPLRKPAPGMPKDVSKSELIAMAKEARAATARRSASVEAATAQRSSPMGELDLVALPKEAREQATTATGRCLPPFAPHLREMAKELKQGKELLEIETVVKGMKEIESLLKNTLNKDAEQVHRTADSAVAKARETMERAPQLQKGLPPPSSAYSPPHPPSCSGLQLPLPSLAYSPTEPTTRNELQSQLVSSTCSPQDLPVRNELQPTLLSAMRSPPEPPARSALAAQRNQDRLMGQSAPNPTAYAHDLRKPKCSPKASPRPSPLLGHQDYHQDPTICTAPTVSPAIAQVWAAQGAQRRSLKSFEPTPGVVRQTSSALFEPKPTVLRQTSSALAPRASPSSSPVQHDRQGRVMPPTFPNQQYPHTQRQAPQTQNVQGYSWMQP